MEFEEVSVEANGLTFVGPALGEGDPVLLLHGFPDTPHTFRHQIPELARCGYRAFAPAMRGYPPTLGGAPGSLGDLAEDVVEIARSLGAGEGRPIRLVGHDWGGIAAYAAAATHPELFSRLAVLSVPHPTWMGGKFLSGDYEQLKRSWYMFLFQQDPLANAIVSANDFDFIEHLINDWSPGLRGDDEAAEMTRRKAAFAQPGVVDAALGYYRAMFGSPNAVGPIQVETMVIFGADDGCISPAICYGMDALFTSGYRFEVIEECGHFVASENPEQVNHLLIDFLTA